MHRWGIFKQSPCFCQDNETFTLVCSAFDRSACTLLVAGKGIRLDCMGGIRWMSLNHRIPGTLCSRTPAVLDAFGLISVLARYSEIGTLRSGPESVSTGQQRTVPPRQAGFTRRAKGDSESLVRKLKHF
jgi:hypothetical protein